MSCINMDVVAGRSRARRPGMGQSGEVTEMFARNMPAPGRRIVPRLRMPGTGNILTAFLMIALLPGAVEAQKQTAAGGMAPMRFEWVREGPQDVCREHCREWISASGMIVDATPGEFDAFAKDR